MNTYHFVKKKNTACTIYFNLRAQASPYDLYQSGGALPVGDATISIDGAAFGNTTNQVQNPQADVYSLTLTAGEMNGNSIVIKVIDAAGGPNWCELFILIETINPAGYPNFLHELCANSDGSEPDNADLVLGSMTFAQAIHFLFARFYHLVTQDTTEQIQYESDGVTPLATHAVSYDLITQTKAAAS